MSGQPVPSPLDPAQLSYSGTPFAISTGTETIPSDYRMVVLHNSGVGTPMAGTPVIADGKYVGQRLLMMMDEASDALEFTNGGQGNTFQIPFDFTLQTSEYGGSPAYPAFQNCVEMVWMGDRWQLAGFPVSPTLQTAAQLPQIISSGVFSMNSSLPLNNADPTVTIDNRSGYAAYFTQTGGDANYTAVPTIGVANAQGMELYFLNTLASDSNITFQDNSVLSGSNLFLSTPTVTLAPGDSITFRQTGLVPSGDGWFEMSRSVKPKKSAQTDPDAATTLPAASLFITLTGDVTMTAVATIAPGQDGQEIVLLNLPASTNAITLQDESTLGGSTLQLATGTVVLNPKDMLTLYYDAGTGFWFEKARAVR